MESAGGSISYSMAKFDSDIKKFYSSAFKLIRQTRRNKMFTNFHWFLLASLFKEKLAEEEDVCEVSGSGIWR